MPHLPSTRASASIRPTLPLRRFALGRLAAGGLLAAGLLAGVAGCNEAGGLGPDVPGTVLDVLAEEGSFDFFFGAANSLGLLAVLDRQGPLTLFAPPNSAFQDLPESARNRLVGDPFLLERTLTYHIGQGARTAQQVSSAVSLPTLNGRSIQTRVVDGRILVDQSTLVVTDRLATNGIVHVVDRLLLPEIFMELYETIEYRSGLETLASLLTLANHEGTVRSERPLTVLAPTDEAFERLPEALRLELQADPELLERVLLYHVIPGGFTAGGLSSEGTVATLEGGIITVEGTGASTTVNGVAFVETNLPAFNGILHVIDEVLLPPDLQEGVGG